MISIQHLRFGAPLSLLLAGVFATGCIDTPNGTTFSGSNIGRVVKLQGFALSAGDTITVEVLSNANANPDSSSSTWIQIGSTTASSNSVYWAGDLLYPFSINVTPVPVWFQGARWPSGGLVRLRAKNGAGNLVQTFDDTDCYGEALGDGKPFATIFSECKSHDTPVLTFVDADPVPQPTNNGADSTHHYLVARETPGQGATYNIATNIPSTLAAWKALRGFPNGEVVARYYNRGDLGIGREMHCRENVSWPFNAQPKFSCYVVNYGSAQDGLADSVSALNDTLLGNNHFATVAMDYTPVIGGEDVQFYTFGPNDTPVTDAELDSEGTKSVPGLCLSCHGGQYIAATQRVSGAKFLPFDMEAFDFAPSGPFSKSAQQEEFRKLNQMVRNNDPGASTYNLINGWYAASGGVNTVGATQDRKYVPSGWSGEPVLYEKVVAPYCRTCHVAIGFPMDSFTQFEGLSNGIQSQVCGIKRMPHAQVTHRSFWASSARAHVVGALNLADACE